MNLKTMNQGFTLLEVLIAVMLTAMVLGSLLTLQSQSKRLAFKADNALHKTINQRAYLNAAWLGSKEDNSYLDRFLSSHWYSSNNDRALKKPEQQSKPLKFHLQAFDIVDNQGRPVLSSVRLKDTELPE